MAAIDRRFGVLGNVAFKSPARAATTADIDLEGLQTIDSVALAEGDRVLVKNQTDGIENGVWVADTGDWERAADFNGVRDVVKGSMLLVTDGGTYGSAVFELATTDPVIGTSSLVFNVVTNSALRFADNAFGLSPLYLFAAGDGVVDDTAIMLEALESGLIVDGGGRSYGISGTLLPSSFKGLRNATLVQLTPGIGRVLSIVDLDNFFIDNVKIDMGTPVNVGTMGDDFGLHIGKTATGCSNFKLNRVEVYNGGPNSGIAIIDGSDFQVSDCVVRDFAFDFGNGNDPIDDVLQMIYLVRCTDFTFSNCHVRRAYGTLYAGDWAGITPRYSRGFTMTGCSLFSLVGCSAVEVDQGFDFTGSLGNSAFTVTGCYARDCESLGFKFANSSNEGLVSNCHVDDCGLVGFVVSGGAGDGVTVPYCRDIHFVNCRAYNIGSFGEWEPNGGVPRGFAVWAGVVADGGDVTYPRGIKFINCHAIDRQASPTMDFGFQADATVVATSPTSTGYDKDELNELIGCSSYGVTTFQQNFHFPFCATGNGGAVTIADSTDSVVVWSGTDAHDSAGMHSTASQPEKVFAKKGGYYDIVGTMDFPANATGIRRLFFKINGAADAIEVEVGGHASARCKASQSITRWLDPGDYVEMWVYQSSGGALDLNRDRSSLEVKLRR